MIKGLLEIAELMLQAYEEEKTLVKYCGACGSDNQIFAEDCAICFEKMTSYTLGVSDETWPCPWCQHPYFVYEVEAIQAKYCKYCLIKWTTELEEAPEEEEEEIPHIPTTVPVRRRQVQRYQPRTWDSTSAGTSATRRVYYTDGGTAATTAGTTTAWMYYDTNTTASGSTY
jgi:hypothetical protein